MLKIGDTLGIVCCSNGQRRSGGEKLSELRQTLSALGFRVAFSDVICEKEDGTSAGALERARALMNFYTDHEIKAIFDISGGDLANGILPYLDYEAIARSGKLFWGYSDLTTVINAIYAKTKKASALYQIRNLISDHGAAQRAAFQRTLLEGGGELFQFDYRMVQKKELHGIVVGGNIRCFLKLAGTAFMPDLTNKILLLESRSGTPERIEAYLCQLAQMEAFERAAGVLLGTFTQLEESHAAPTAVALVQKIAGRGLPIAATRDIGHGTDAKGVLIGRELHLFA